MPHLLRNLSLITLVGAMCASNAASAAEEPAWTDLELGLIGSSYSMEGPGTTGYVEVTEQTKRKSGVGGYARGRLALGSWTHLASEVSVDRVDGGNVTILRSHLAPGVHWHPGAGFALFAQGGLAFAWVNGLENYSDRLPVAQGNGGTDVGLHVATGVRQRFFSRFEWDAMFGYQSYGSEDYPNGAGDGRSSGDGPIAGIGLAYDVGAQWAVTGGWTGIWVEDANFAMDLDGNQFRLGLRRTF
jgi:hypothetical protein